MPSPPGRPTRPPLRGCAASPRPWPRSPAALLAWAAAVPAASAAIIPVPGDGPYGPVPAATVRVITAGGMPGWQITLIAVAAGLVAATAAVVLDRARASRRAAATTG